MSGVLNSIPDNDLYVLLGDFNAHIGSRDSTQDQWGSERGAECNIDHQFLCVKLRMTWKCPKHKTNEMRRFDVARLRCASGVEVEETGYWKQKFVEEVLERAREDCPESGTVVGKCCFRDHRQSKKEPARLVS